MGILEREWGGKWVDFVEGKKEWVKWEICWRKVMENSIKKFAGSRGEIRN